MEVPPRFSRRRWQDPASAMPLGSLPILRANDPALVQGSALQLSNIKADETVVGAPLSIVEDDRKHLESAPRSEDEVEEPIENCGEMSLSNILTKLVSLSPVPAHQKRLVKVASGSVDSAINKS
eukprot:IDg16858t1